MKRILPVSILFVLLIPFTLPAQSWQWAYTMGSTPRSQAVAIKKDHLDNFYVASYTDSVAIRKSTQVEKRDPSQQSVWHKQIDGEATITDVEINAANHAVVVGYFLGTITVDGNTLTSFSPSDNSGFIFETDETGSIQWIHDLNPVGGDFKSGELFIAPDGNMYLTSEVSGSFGFCAFHKLNSQGVITKNEFNNNFENRTFSHILSDSDGHVYLSGTCGNGATFDTITANPAFSYQNFLISYDSTFKAQWFIAREYITFDHNNSLSTDGQNLFWAFDDFTSSADTIRIIKCDRNGQILNSVAGPLGNSFFPSVSFEVDPSGNGVLAANVFARIFLFRYDTDFNITWQDTILTSTSGFPFLHGLSVYDSSFYLTSYYLNDTLMVDNFMLLNPNVGTNYPSDIFVARWSMQQTVSVNPVERNNSVAVFPNPVQNELTVQSSNFKSGELLRIFDSLGNLVYSEIINAPDFKIQASHFNKGIYFLQVTDTARNVYAKMKLVVL